LVSRFVRKVRTASGAVAVQVVTRRGRQVEGIEHVESAHTDAELALLLAAAREQLSPGQDVLDFRDLRVVPARMDEVADWTGEPELPVQPAKLAAGGRPASVAAGGRVVGTSADLLWAVLTSAYARLGFDVLAVARHLQDAAGTSIKKIVQTLRTARSATIEINGQRLTIDPDLTDAARDILKRLESGH
jgi:hypothetical protein